MTAISVTTPYTRDVAMIATLCLPKPDEPAEPGRTALVRQNRLNTTLSAARAMDVYPTIRADSSHFRNLSSSSAAVPVIVGCALNNAPPIPSQAPGPTPPGTLALPPYRTVCTTSNPT